jgi:bisphosphoglycerate-independent phosphoglycerate mutase (AlkP superfamily)
VLLSNRPIQLSNPSLIDIAPTIFAQFGIPQPDGMIGHSIFSSNH